MLILRRVRHVCGFTCCDVCLLFGDLVVTACFDFTLLIDFVFDLFDSFLVLFSSEMISLWFWRLF